MKKPALILLAIAAPLLNACSSGSNEAAEYRHSIFHVIAWHFGTLGAMAKGEQPFDQAVFERKAGILENLAQLPWEGFPEGSADGSEVLQLHADHTYHANPLADLLPEAGPRGAGAELRLFDVDPDSAAARVEGAGGMILQPPTNKPHGLREAYILDPDGYCWVPSRPLTDAEVEAVAAANDANTSIHSNSNTPANQED